jgi:drug/metabolite transporter (DMT)-like permease
MSAVASSSSVLDWALLVVPGLIWGASFLFIAESLEALAPDGVTFVRFVIGFVTLSLVPGARRPVLSRDRAGIAWLGILWLAFPMSMFPHAEQHVSSALTGMLNGAIPLIAAGVAALVAWQAPSPTVLAGLIVGFGGAVVMAIPGIDAGGHSARGVLLISAALVSYGVAINLARPLQQRNGALPVVWRALAIALIVTAPLGAPAVLAAHPRSRLAAARCVWQATFALVDELERIARAHDSTVARIALAWVQTQPGVTSTIIGARRSAQLEDNVQAIDVRLTAEELDRLNTLTTPTLGFPQSMQPMFPAIHNGGTTVNGLYAPATSFGIEKGDQPY